MQYTSLKEQWNVKIMSIHLLRGWTKSFRDQRVGLLVEVFPYKLQYLSSSLITAKYNLSFLYPLGMIEEIYIYFQQRTTMMTTCSLETQHLFILFVFILLTRNTSFHSFCFYLPFVYIIVAAFKWCLTLSKTMHMHIYIWDIYWIN